MENYKNLQKLAKMLDGHQMITTEELGGLVKDIVNAFSQYRSATTTINQETKDTLNLIVKQVNAEHERILADVVNTSTKSKSDVTEALKAAVKECKAMYEEIMTMRPQDGAPGLDADEEVIIEKVLEKLPKVKELIPDTPEEVVTKINSSKKKIKGSQIEGLAETVNNLSKSVTMGGVQAPILDVYNAGSLVKTRVTKVNFSSGATVSGDTVNVTVGGGGGAGDVVGPASSTDNAVTRYDGTTGKLIQNSGVTIDDSNNINLPGNLTFSGRARRIIGDFTNATLGDRTYLQTSTANSSSIVGTIPSGTGTFASSVMFSSSDPANSSYISLHADASGPYVGLNTSKSGTGTTRDMVFQIDGVTNMVLNTSGNVGVGTTSLTARLTANQSAVVTALASQPGMRVTSAGSSSQVEMGVYTGGYAYIQGSTSGGAGNTLLINPLGSATVGIGITTTPGGLLQVAGTVSASRTFIIDTLGRVTQRYDDNSLQYLTTLANRAITAANQGAGILWQLADTGAAGVNAGSISVLSENTTFAGATADSRMVFATTLDGSLNNRMWLTSAGGLSLGSSTNTNSSLRISKTITGGTSAYGVFQDGVVQSDVTSDVAYNRTVLSTAAAAFTVPTAYHYNATQTTLGAGSTVTNQIGFNAESSLTGATNNYGFYGAIASGTGRWNIYMTGTAQNYLAGNTGVGATPFTDTSLRIGGAPGTASILYGIYLNTAIPATTTGAYDSNISIPSVAASAFTLGTLRHFRATQGTIGAGATVTNQFGFFADSSLTGATNDYGFYGDIAAGTGRWNLYMNGTAANYFAGTLTVPQVYNTDVAATVAANAATITRASRNNTFTNSSAAAMTITLSTTGAVGGDMLLVQIYDFSAVAQTITWVNTENSTVTAPVTSNGSTTLPLTVGFKWNASTSKWRCIASC